MFNGSSGLVRLSDSSAWLCSAALMLTAVACSSPGSAPSNSVLVQGIVRGETPPGRMAMPPPTLAGADVSVIAGPAAGTTTTTDSNGAYRLQLPPGTFKLHWSKPGYLPMDSPEGIVSNQGITMTDVVLGTAPWAITGVVSDGRGNPVTGATVAICCSDGILTNFATPTTDGNGNYRFASARPHFSTVTVFARKDGYETGTTTTVACCATAGDTRFDVRLRRIVAMTMDGPSTLAVGDEAALPINDITLDDGSHRFIYLLPTSSDPSVVAVERGFQGQQGYGVRGVSPGTAIVTCDWEKYAVQLQVRVADR